MRLCVRSGCRRRAVATLTYVYAESSAVLGPLSPEQHPGGYDLCSEHSGELTVPKGWELIRLPGVDGTEDEHEPDDIMALARAVREIGMLDDEIVPTSGDATAESHGVPDMAGVTVLGRRGHLAVIADRDSVR
ncbi:MAG: DUF3499 domain-containing protein [Cutibacterium granulosum]|nr:DUF3499 domain-containing protein [Cutibacterium granulosum]